MSNEIVNRVTQTLLGGPRWYIGPGGVIAVMDGEVYPFGDGPPKKWEEMTREKFIDNGFISWEPYGFDLSDYSSSPFTG